MTKMPIVDPLPADRAALNHARMPVAAAPRRRLSHATEPHILYPTIAVLVLALIWGTTLNLIKVERDAAERAAATSAREFAATYESQVVRALREIDQALKLVKYASELGGRDAILQELKARTLLPPDLLFVVSIANSGGDVVASTLPSAMANVADQESFQSQRQADAFAVSRPRQDRGSGEWKLQFTRRLNTVDGRFSGVAMVSVDAGYFVSGYETSKLGEHGVLGLLGTDGVFRARRSGAAVTAGDVADYAAVVPATDEAENRAALSTNAWDGVRRYTSARQLYGFPLAVIVGLSEVEQLAATRRDMRAYVWRASAGSLVLIVIVAALGYMSWQLALSRRRVVEDQGAHTARVEHLAYHDGLTTLPNRSLFSQLLAQSIHLARRNHAHLAVLFLDLDGFKQINDSFGHDTGDRLLQEVAVRLKACLRDSDTVARLGGDEFVALLPDLEEERYAATVAQKILSAVALPFVLLGQDYRITASVGISVYPHDGLDEQTLAQNADLAMYQAKEEGRNKFRFYSGKMNTNARGGPDQESNLRHALVPNESRLL